MRTERLFLLFQTAAQQRGQEINVVIVSIVGFTVLRSKYFANVPLLSSFRMNKDFNLGSQDI